MRQVMEVALLVFNVPEVPQLDGVVDRGRRQQPITTGVELCMGHFSLVQLVTENLKGKREQSH